jgi:uncharacterized damage-inducible protein DinB
LNDRPAGSLAAAWGSNHDATMYLLDHLPDEWLEDRYSSRTRTVASQFAHLHSVRVYHLQKRGQEFLGDLTSFGRGVQPTRRELTEALEASAPAVGRFLDRCEEENRVTSWHGPPASWLAYITGHEAHHRALVMVSLRLAGHKAPQELKYGIWNWGRRGGIR